MSACQKGMRSKGVFDFYFSDSNILTSAELRRCVPFTELLMGFSLLVGGMESQPIS